MENSHTSSTTLQRRNVRVVENVEQLNLSVSGEGKNGYWTEGETRGLWLCISTPNTITVTKETKRVTTETSETTTETMKLDEEPPQEDDAFQRATISLWSEHWYRTQRFDLDGFTAASAWSIVADVLCATGRTLLELTDESVSTYRLQGMTLAQVNQLYYLLKHNLTATGASFSISHSLMKGARSDETLCPAPRKKTRRRRKKVMPVVQRTWAEVAKNGKVKSPPPSNPDNEN
jgi:hypothetical protein